MLVRTPGSARTLRTASTIWTMMVSPLLAPQCIVVGCLVICCRNLSSFLVGLTRRYGHCKLLWRNPPRVQDDQIQGVWIITQLTAMNAVRAQLISQDSEQSIVDDACVLTTENVYGWWTSSIDFFETRNYLEPGIHSCSPPLLSFASVLTETPLSVISFPLVTDKRVFSVRNGL